MCKDHRLWPGTVVSRRLGGIESKKKGGAGHMRSVGRDH
jgi:hypothetical protein